VRRREGLSKAKSASSSKRTGTFQNSFVSGAESLINGPGGSLLAMRKDYLPDGVLQIN